MKAESTLSLTQEASPPRKMMVVDCIHFQADQNISRNTSINLD